MIGLLILAAILVGCGGGEADTPPTRVPTRIPPTPTPRSTPLPDVPNAPALGDADRPIAVQFALLGTNPASDARRAAGELRAALEDQLGLQFTVDFVDENTALASLCSGAPSAAWVSSFTYAAAQAQCDALPALAVRRGRAPNVSVGQTAEIVARADVTALDQLGGQTFCRSDEQDLFTSWVFPSLLMKRAGVDPLLELAAIQDYPDDLALGRALYDGTCAAAALPPGALEDLLIDLATDLSAEGATVTADVLGTSIRVLVPAGDVGFPSNPQQWRGFGTGVIPYEVLVFPPASALPDALRSRITEVIAAFFNDRASGTQRLRVLLGATGIAEVSAGDYQAFRTLIADAGWNMTFSD